MQQQRHFTIDISIKTIVLLTLFPLFLFFLWIIRDLLFAFLIGFILMSALKPGVSLLESRKVPRSLAVLIVYLIFLTIFISLISLIIPPIIIETTHLIQIIPGLIQSLDPNIKQWIDVESLTQFLPDAANRLFEVVELIRGFFSNALFVLFTLFFGFYFLMEESLIRNFIARYFDEDKTQKFVSVFDKAEKRMSSWFWGELTLMLVVGTLTYIGLNILGVKYALPLAVLAGLLEVIPNLGPLLSSIPAMLVASTYSPLSVVSVGALYFIIQQLENNLIVPMVMKKAVGLNPIVTLIALSIGGRIGGILGVLLGIPVFLFAETIISEIFRWIKSSEKTR
jgi:predicted PurR-regulated permease PerM